MTAVLRRLSTCTEAKFRRKLDNSSDSWSISIRFFFLTCRETTQQTTIILISEVRFHLGVRNRCHTAHFIRTDCSANAYCRLIINLLGSYDTLDTACFPVIIMIISSYRVLNSSLNCGSTRSLAWRVLV